MSTIRANAIVDAAGGNTTTVNGAVPASLASPALTGTPTAPTATVGTNTTQIATTAFVLANGVAPTTAQVGTATAGLAAGAVGTYAYAVPNNSTAYAFGATISGSILLPVNSLIYDATSGNATACTTGAALSGTWQCMGNRANNRGNTNSATLWLRTV